MRDTRSQGTRTGQGARGRGGYTRDPGYGAPRGAAVQAGYQRGAHAAAKPTHTPQRRFRLTAAGVGAAALVVVVVAAVIVGMAANNEKKSYYADTLTSGIRINGQDYSGWDVKALRKRLKDQMQQKINDISIKVTWQDQAWAFGGEDLGPTENVDEVVSKAALLARVGTLEQRREEAAAIRKDGRDYPVALTLNPEKLKAALAERTADVTQAGHDATAVFNPALVDFEIPTNIEDLNPPQSEIDKMFIVNPEEPGKNVDVDMTVQKIMEALQKDSHVELELIVDDFVPQVTEAKLREGFHLITAYRTQLPSTNAEAKPRIDNIELALSKFNGMVLKPGESLSFNETTGPRTEANGYQPAPTIGGNKAIVDDFGGGVCQASTTLYNAALMAGCEILDRGPHSFPSSYAWKGFDAMVNWPNADLQFKNPGAANLYIKAYVKRPYVYVMVFGKLPEGISKITRRSETTYKGPDPKVETRVDKKGEYTEQLKKEDPYVLVKGQPEMRFKAYLVYWGMDGKVKEEKELYEDHFKEITRVEIVSEEPPATPDAPQETTGNGVQD